MNFMHKFAKLSLFTTTFLSAVFGFASPIMALPGDLRGAPKINVTIAESTDAARRDSGWWPSNFEAARPWVEAFRTMGSEVIAPYEISNPPRLSPTVYGQYPLSNSTAKTMASLFGASIVVNGQIAYACESRDLQYTCAATAKIDLTAGNARLTSIDRTYRASAKSIDNAQRQIRQRIAFELEPAIIVAQNTGKKSLPAIVSYPVLRFASMPDADALVAMRKCIKRIDGVTDIAERFVANGMIAIEINPNHAPIGDDFRRIVDQFVANGCEDYQLQEIASSPQGSTIEVAKF